MIEPSAEMVERVISMGYVVRVGEGFDYSEGVKESTRGFLKARHGMLENVRLQRAVADLALPVFIAYPDSAKERNLMLTVTLFTYLYSKKMRIDLKGDRDSANLLYTLFYLDQLIPDVKI